MRGVNGGVVRIPGRLVVQHHAKLVQRKMLNENRSEIWHGMEFVKKQTKCR